MRNIEDTLQYYVTRWYIYSKGPLGAVTVRCRTFGGETDSCSNANGASLSNEAKYIYNGI